MTAYVNWLTEFSKKHVVDIHARALMTNHVHLLCTPQKKGAISRMMQPMGRMYLRYYNAEYQPSGPLWDGRYKSGLVDSEQYLLELYRYIELNPVRADMVREPGEYRWSSYACNALGIETELQTPHPVYLALGNTKEERLRNYQALCKADVGTALLKEIRDSVNRGLALGSERFTQQIEALTERRVTPR